MRVAWAVKLVCCGNAFQLPENQMAKKMSPVDMTNASYSPAKGSAKTGGAKMAPYQPGKAKMTTTLPGWMDSRPANSDRNQSAK